MSWVREKLILPAVLVAALAALVVSMDSGIWDPWEMNRAHVARQIAGRAKVLVIEKEGTLRKELEKQYGEDYFFVGFDGLAPNKVGSRKTLNRDSRLLKKADKKLKAEIFHGVFVESSLLTADPLRGVDHLNSFKQESPGARFYLLADTAEECGEVVAILNQAMAEEAAGALKNSYRLLPADADVHALASERAGGYPFVLDVPCLARDGEELPTALESLSAARWTRVQFKGIAAPKTKKKPSPAKNSHLAPPLDYWLTAASYVVFGFSETSSRLPSVLFGFLTLLVFVLGIRRLTDSNTALLAGLILISIPMFFGQAKNMSGEMSYTFFLTSAVILFALTVKEGFATGRFAALIAAVLLLFLAKGLFGLLCVLLIFSAYIILTRDFRRKEVLLPVGALGGLFVLFMLLVQLPDEWTFFTHFKLMNRPFMGGPRTELRTFEFFVRQVSFGIMPWTLLLPFAFARLVPVAEKPNVESHRERLNLLVLLWFAVPFMLHTALLHDFLHVVFPAVTSVALAVALMWRSEEKEVNRFWGCVMLGIAAVIMANLLKTPEQLVAYLTTDPQFGGKGGQKFPPDYSLTAVGKALLTMVALVAFVYYVRGGTIFKSVLRFFRRRRAFWSALWVAAALLVVRLVAGLARRYSMALSSKGASKLAPEYVEFLNELFAARLETVMLYMALAAYLFFAIFHFTRAGEKAGTLFGWLAWPGRGIRFLFRFVGKDLVGLGVALILTAAALAVMLATFEFPESFFSALKQMPSTIAAMAVGIACPLLTLVSMLLAAIVRKRTMNWAAMLRAAATCVVLALLIVTSTLFRQTDLASPDIWILSLAAFSVLGLYWANRFLASPPLFHLAGWGLLITATLVLFVPLAIRWPHVEAVVFPKTQVPFLKYLLLESRLTWGPVLLFFVALSNVFVLEVLGFFSDMKPIGRMVDRLGAGNPAVWPEQIERKKVFTAVMIILTLAFGGFYGIYLLPGFSREVSQKHILEIYYESEDRSDLGTDIYKYQKKATGDLEDMNFYTAQIPAISSQQDLSRILLGREDAIVKVSRSSSHPGPSHMLVRGFGPGNDVDEDGERDFDSDAGMATAVGERSLEDTTKSWEPDQWKGYVLVDWRGNELEITGNSEQTLALSLTPPTNMQRENTRRYVIDDPSAPNHRASATQLRRNYVILSQEAFSSVNFSFRSKSKGMHIPVLDGSNANFLLASSYLKPGEENHNRFAKSTVDPEAFQALKDWTEAPPSESYAGFGLDEELGKFGRLKSGFINFDNQIRFAGYQMENPSPARGDKLRLRLFFECTGKVASSWKIFIHMDSTAASNRIHGDHWPLNMSNDPEEKQCVGCWRTNHWMKGDIVLDDYQTDVPLGSPAGIYNIYMGFYTPGSDKRLKVKDYNKKKVRHDGKNRVFLGTFEVH